MFSGKHNTTASASPLNQFQDICRKAVKTSLGRLHKSFNNILAEISLLMLLLPHKANFTQLEKYGKHSESCYRQNFSRLSLRDSLIALSRYIVVDAYFSVKPFADGLCSCGFHLISRLRDNASLRYLYEGPRSTGRGRPKIDTVRPGNSESSTSISTPLYALLMSQKFTSRIYSWHLCRRT